MRQLVLLFLCGACHRSNGDPNIEKPSSCVIEHDGGVTQCFEEIGASAKKGGSKNCDEMHGQHTFHVAEACPKDGVVGSCTKKQGTDFERVERCYRDEPACEARCVKSAGIFTK
ncbi:MAG TPA: hypothetical protein VGH87_16635 [Polyangiaceae bacterium]